MSDDRRLPYQSTWRDRFAHQLATAALRIATPTYRSLLRGSYLMGLRCAQMECETCHVGPPAGAP